MSSILEDVKKTLGIHAAIDEFDTDLIMHVNSAFFQLHQLGVGPKGGFSIEGADTEWEAFLGPRQDLSIVKSYVTIFVRLVFDRPETSYGIQALERMRDEWGWRLELQAREVPYDPVSGIHPG